MATDSEQPKGPVTTLDDSAAEARYANMVRILGTPEEVIMDTGLNPNPFAQVDQTVKLDNRIVMDLFSAKRLYLALGASLQRHEQNFGTIELDIRKRISPAVIEAAQAQAAAAEGDKK